jgi:hypothetical protein
VDKRDRNIIPELSGRIASRSPQLELDLRVSYSLRKRGAAKVRGPRWRRRYVRRCLSSRESSSAAWWQLSPSSIAGIVHRPHRRHIAAIVATIAIVVATIVAISATVVVLVHLVVVAPVDVIHLDVVVMTKPRVASGGDARITIVSAVASIAAAAVVVVIATSIHAIVD